MGRPNPHAAATNGRVVDAADPSAVAIDAGLVRDIIGQAPVMLFSVDPDGVITGAEGGLLAAVGLRNGETVGLRLDTVYPDAPDLDRDLRHALGGVDGRTVVRTAGRTLEVWYGPQVDAAGDVVGVVGVACEITAAHRARALVRHQTAVLQRVLHGTSLQESLRAITVWVESAADGLRCDLLIPDPLVPPSEVDARWIFPVVTDRGATVGSLVGRPDSPRWPTAEEHGLLALGARLAAIVIERDRSRERMEQAVLRDPLTGLPSRAQLLRTLDAMVRDDVPPALLFCDVDRFKLINDSLGPDFGDRVLAAVAARLRSTVRESDVVARVGGDEFVVLLSRISGEAEAEEMARRILARVIAPMAIDGRHLLTTMSIGVALPDPGDTAADLFSRGDMAMSEAKQGGRERYVVWRRSNDGNVALRRLELETGIRAALTHDELRLHFQPIVRCDNGQIASLEALVRWQHPDRGMVPPGEFLPVAKDAGLLDAIDRWVLREACRQVAGSTLQTSTPLPVVSVNLAGLPPDELQIAGRILEDARAFGLQPRQLIIEVTEELLGAEECGAVEAFERLRSHGVRIAVDDFGTGYSSLNRLKSLPVDVLKVDRSFVTGLGEEPEAAALLDAIVTMGHALGMEIVAEGVESAVQFEELRRLGCDMAQGYHLGRPAPLSDL
ncbi:MAG TPA: EAL domain-containing protein [Euzebyales bacterium]|nr:EAL domain-containing protein [Euzebyales bacterium]